VEAGDEPLNSCIAPSRRRIRGCKGRGDDHGKDGIGQGPPSNNNQCHFFPRWDADQSSKTLSATRSKGFVHRKTSRQRREIAIRGLGRVIYELALPLDHEIPSGGIANNTRCH